MKLVPGSLARFIGSLLALTLASAATAAAPRWTPEAAHQWVAQHGWLVGCNYIPANAVNELEMWQAETFDPARIDLELGWAEALGFNSVRVFLHNLAWQQDPEGFFQRFDRFLQIAAKHHITAMPVIFDACWDPAPHVGPQPAPRPGVHNSQWLQSPGTEVLGNPLARAGLEGYLKSVLGRYRDDRRIVAWDLFNEPDSADATKDALDLPLLRDAFQWAREVNPSQPLTSGVAAGFGTGSKPSSPVNDFAYENADIISIHCYGKLDDMRRMVANARSTGRPVFCTEYLARGEGSTFEAVLPYLKSEGVAAYNWGFVAGRTQTIYPWDSNKKPYTAEPAVWHHDILHVDGTPFRQSEIDFLKKLLAPAK